MNAPHTDRHASRWAPLPPHCRTSGGCGYVDPERPQDRNPVCPKCGGDGNAKDEG